MTYLNAPAHHLRSARPAFPSLKGMLSLHRQRRALGTLSPEQLKDIGVTKEQAMAEAHRSVWDFPETYPYKQ